MNLDDLIVKRYDRSGRFHAFIIKLDNQNVTLINDDHFSGSVIIPYHAISKILISRPHINFTLTSHNNSGVNRDVKFILM